MKNQSEDFKFLFENWNPKKKENKIHNIFEIGTRGLFENPFTEILSYILKENNQYENRNEFVNLFLSNIPNLENEIIESFLIDIKIITQHTTVNNNFIDLIIYNDSYVLIFENKINHWLANPLDDYENDMKLRFSNRKQYFYILSYKPIETPFNWTNILISELFITINKNITKKYNNKWDYFIEDFLLHYIPKQNEIMENEEFEFFSKNFSKIIEANNKFNDYVLEIISKIKEKFPIDTINRISNENKWGDANTRAVRLFPDNSNSNVVFVFQKEGTFSISIYYYKEISLYLKSICDIVGNSNYKNWKEGSVICFTRLDNKTFNKIEDAIDECVIQIENMIKI
jgi:hypothetical protein